MRADKRSPEVVACKGDRQNVRGTCTWLPTRLGSTSAAKQLQGSFPEGIPRVLVALASLLLFFLAFIVIPT